MAMGSARRLPPKERGCSPATLYPYCVAAEGSALPALDPGPFRDCSLVADDVVSAPSRLLPLGLPHPTASFGREHVEVAGRSLSAFDPGPLPDCPSVAEDVAAFPPFLRLRDQRGIPISSLYPRCICGLGSARPALGPSPSPDGCANRDSVDRGSPEIPVGAAPPPLRLAR